MEWDGADPADMLKIGDGPARLREQICHVLETPQAHPAPRDVPGHADQAAAFMDLTAGLWQRPPGRRARAGEA